MTKTEAHEGELVELAVDVAGGDGFAVTFVVTTAAGDALTRLDAPVEAGVARASWVVDLDGARPPVDVTFTAQLADQVVQAGKLAVVRSVVIGPVALVPIPLDDSVARGAVGPVRTGDPAGTPGPLPPLPGLGGAAPRDSYVLVLDLDDAGGGPVRDTCDLEAVLEEARPGAAFAAAKVFDIAIRDVPGHRYHVVFRVPDGSSGPDAISYRMRVRGARQQPTPGLTVDPAEHTTGVI